MNCKLLFFLLFILISFNIHSQTTYFIKYKSSVPISAVDQKVTEQRFSEIIGDRPVSLPEFNINYLAKGLGRGDEVLGRIIKIQFSEDVEEADFSSMLTSDTDIEYVQKAFTYRMDFVPNDSLVNEQWALEKIDAFDAWDITQGSDTILVSIVDTGIDYLHPDLANKIYYNPNEIPDNSIDDDSNGFIDDYMGWDFVDRVGFPFDTTAGDYLVWDNDPMDQHSGSHGTAVAGIIGAEANNNSGIAGIAPSVKILNVRSFDPGGYGDEDDAAAAILYSVMMGAKVINMSWGDYSFSYVLRDVIRYAYSQNVVLVGSSGNTTTTTLHYPSGFPEVISVGNSTEEDFTSGSYGSTLDLVAPGTSITTTIRNAGYTLGFSGTSAASPHVSATAALILSLQNFTNEEVKQIIKSTADDIGETGWDLRTGAGRLNLFKALTVLAPAVIKFNFPAMDYATNGNSIEINASVLSPYFVSYNLQVGEGDNPEQWNTLIQNGRSQFKNENIYNLDISDFADNVYTLRLIVFQNNGGTLEERINFHIMRSPPKLTEVGSGPIYYGDKSTIGAEFYTSQKSIVRLFFRKVGETEFRFITLDGFNTNNQFVKQFHYGFIPKDLVTPSTDYEIYYEAENLAGLKTKYVDTLNNLNNFIFHTASLPEIVNYQVMSFSLPRGSIFEKPVSFLSDNYNEVLFQQFYTSQDVYYTLYELQGDSFNNIDSIKNKIPRDFGDFNNNGKKDLLSSEGRAGFIDEQVQPFTFQLENKLSIDTSFYPIFAQDLDNDGKTEIITNINDTLIRVYTLNSDFSIGDSKNLPNYSYLYPYDRQLNFPNHIYGNVSVADLNGDGIKEFWFVDYDGDLISYKISGQNNFAAGDSLITNLITNNNHILSSGDFDGDGVEEIAVLFETNSIAPNFLFLVFNYKNNILNILYENVFLDQSAEFLGFGFSEVYQTVKFVDVDVDGKSELVLNIFPFVYILKYNIAGTKIIYFDEGINSEYIFSGDINQNGVTEIALQTAEGIKFYEFAPSNKALTPYAVKGFSIDSTTINLSWEGTGERFLIYKAFDENVELIDSTTSKIYIDTSVTKNKSYFYAIQAYDALKEDHYSNLSTIIEVYSHEPARVNSVANNSPKSLIVTFSEKIRTTVENLRAFEIQGFGFPNSISPSNQYSYLLSFNDNLPVGSNNVIVKNLNDFYGSPINEHTFQFNVREITSPEEFFISSFDIISPYRIKLTFNFNVDETSAVVKENYFFEPENIVASIEIDQANKKIIYLNLDGKKPVGSIGREYRLRVVNLKSSLETGGLTINSGAGSYVVLTSFARDLSDVYVYPNPANVERGKVTFANLPKRAKIVIFTLSGEKINEIEEADGNGGVDFNLSYSTGETLSSGVYIYRIVMLDDSDNELDEKIGKFAVIR